MQQDDVLLADTLTQRIGVLARRETEARILAPIIEALSEVFGREKVLTIVKDAIIKIAREQGQSLAQTTGACGAKAFVEGLQYWTKDGALQLDVLQQDEQTVNFNVTRCRYAEMYRALGIAELGATLSCNRDYALIEGFNPDAKLRRSQTIMQGASHCDFRYQFSVQQQDDTAT